MFWYFYFLTKKAVSAELFHCLEANDLETRHHMCPRTNDSWCKYQADKMNDTNTYKEKPGKQVIVRDKIKPICSK